jgi:multiple sugar transport system substrate-binding protein
MNKMMGNFMRMLYRITAALLLVAFTGACQGTGKVTVTWLVDTGSGWGPDPAWVEEYNASQDEIELVLTYEHFSPDWLMTQVAGVESGQATPPDIIGPIGLGLHRQLAGYWLDLEPYYDHDSTSQVIPGALAAWQSEDGALTGMPVTADPLVLFYDRDLFDAAGLPYPPHEYGEPYADGDAWTMTKLEEIAIQLTLDEHGYRPTEPGFDPGAIVQFGLSPQWLGLPEMAAPFGPAAFGEEGELPASWRGAFLWYWQGIRELHFIGPDSSFDSGQVAMSVAYGWSTCCIENVLNWDLAVLPSYEGGSCGMVGSQGFAVLDTSEHPREAAQALLALAAYPQLVESLGAFPAWLPLEPDYFDVSDQRFPQDVDWMVIVNSLTMPAIPHYDSLPPISSEAFEAMQTFQIRLFADPAMDVNAALDELEAQLQGTYSNR